MKTQTKSQAILNALLSGEKLTTKSCMVKCGTYKLSNRLSELEEKYNFLAKRKNTQSKSRYGGVDTYLLYWLEPDQIKEIKRKIKL